MYSNREKKELIMVTLREVPPLLQREDSFGGYLHQINKYLPREILLG